ncbi:MAG: septum formation family protein [Ilumatobacter sp.]|uniref:septum formation family protein n=1 Tax=Ilumatobacter sp. TaxID=1967498 RepID=UPI00391930A3
MALTLALALVGPACSGDDDEGLGLIDVGDEGPGTCLDVPLDQGPDIERLPVIACGEPHSHEIYAVALVDDDVYPGFEALETFAQAQCLKEFEAYVGVSAFDSDLFYSWIVPTLTSWESDSDREVLCVAGNGNGAPLVGTIRNTAR